MRHVAERKEAESRIERRFLSERELEIELGIPRKTLQRWRFEGSGPQFRKFGGAVKYSVSDVALWIASRPTGGERTAA